MQNIFNIITDLTNLKYYNIAAEQALKYNLDQNSAEVVFKEIVDMENTVFNFTKAKLIDHILNSDMDTISKIDIINYVYKNKDTEIGFQISKSSQTLVTMAIILADNIEEYFKRFGAYSLDNTISFISDSFKNLPYYERLNIEDEFAICALEAKFNADISDLYNKLVK